MIYLFGFFMGKGLFLLLFFLYIVYRFLLFCFILMILIIIMIMYPLSLCIFFWIWKKKILIINCMIWAKKLINIFLYAIRNFISYFQPERMLCDYFVWNHRKDSKGNINDLIKILNTQILYIELLQSLLYIISCRQG